MDRAFTAERLWYKIRFYKLIYLVNDDIVDIWYIWIDLNYNKKN